MARIFIDFVMICWSNNYQAYWVWIFMHFLYWSFFYYHLKDEDIFHSISYLLIFNFFCWYFSLDFLSIGNLLSHFSQLTDHNLHLILINFITFRFIFIFRLVFLVLWIVFLFSGMRVYSKHFLFDFNGFFIYFVFYVVKLDEISVDAIFFLAIFVGFFHPHILSSHLRQWKTFTLIVF